MKNCDWTRQLKPLYQRALQRYHDGDRDWQTWFDATETAELASIGATPMELFDYAEDSDSLDWETALLITAVRRDYFLVMQHGVHSSNRINMEELPAKTAALDGIPWLPRIIQKAQGRLRGELPNELMFCCGGDRAFLKEHDLHPADFLREIWAAGRDEKRILAYVKSGGKF
jgi:hypothetical protein